MSAPVPGDALAGADNRSPRPVIAVEQAPPPDDMSDSETEAVQAPPPKARREHSRTRSHASARNGSRTRSRHNTNQSRASEHDGGGLRPTASVRSNRPLRFRDGYEDDMDADYRSDPREYDNGRYWRDDPNRHPDNHRQSQARSRNRPPRAYLNNPERYEEYQEALTPKPFLTETTSVYSPALTPNKSKVYDEEMGYTYGPQTPRYASSTNGGSRPITLGPNGKIDFRALSKEERSEVLRLPWTQWMNSSVKNHFVASLGEFVGTTLFLFFAFGGTEVANIGSNVSPSNSSSSDSNTTTGATTGFNVAVLLYISVAFGFSLMVNVWIFFRISGGLFNPAVTLAMLLVRAISATRAACLFVSQMLGALLASVIVRFLFPENFNVRTTLGGGATQVQGVFIEAILTAELVFTIFMLAKEKHRATFIAPVGIGLALFISEMVGVEFTGGSLNPARSFGPCAVTATFDPEHWIYWVGPMAGSLIAVAFYKFIKTLEYEMANPGADGDPENDPTKNPEKRHEIRNSK